jgi:hypothetical protein
VFADVSCAILRRRVPLVVNCFHLPHTFRELRSRTHFAIDPRSIYSLS